MIFWVIPFSHEAQSQGKQEDYFGIQLAIGISSKKLIADKLEELEIDLLNFKNIIGVATHLDSYIRGSISYFGRYEPLALSLAFLVLRQRLVWWVRKRYKRCKTNMIKAYLWLDRVKKQSPNLFYQWRYGFS